MSTLGHQTDVEYLPEGPYDLQDIGRKPVARIALRPNPAAQRDALADYVFQRQTNRRPYSGPLLSDDDEAERVRAQLPPDTAELLVRNRPQDMRPLLDVFYRAMEIEVTTPRTWEETRIWFRYDERRRRARRDRLSAAQAGLDGIRRRLMEAYLRNGDPTRWFSARSSSSFLKGIREGVDSARGVLLLKTPTNRQLDWLLAGRAFARVHPGAHAARPDVPALQPGAAGVPPPEMVGLQAEFNRLLGMREPARVQMAVRVGRAKLAYIAPRRDPQDLLSDGPE